MAISPPQFGEHMCEVVYTLFNLLNCASAAGLRQLSGIQTSYAAPTGLVCFITLTHPSAFACARLQSGLICFRTYGAQAFVRSTVGSRDILIRGDRGVRTGLAQALPLFRQVNIQIGFRPEDLAAKVARRAAQHGDLALAVRLNAATAAEAVDFIGYKAGLRGAVRKEAEPVGISRNSHFLSPFLVNRTKFMSGGCQMNVVPLSG